MILLKYVINNPEMIKSFITEKITLVYTIIVKFKP